MSRQTSVAMTATLEEALVSRLDRPDGQEDVCLATYRPSTGATRVSALVRSVIPPEPGDRYVHGNATVTGNYILRAAGIAQRDNCGLVLLHSHPGASRWQPMSGPDRVAESSYANLVREVTELPLVGMTLATGDGTWSARHWNIGFGRQVDCSHSTSVRVIGDRFDVSWNDELCPPPLATESQPRTLSSWGEQCQANLVRRRVLVVGAGSVGLDLALRLAASGLCNITVMDFDIVEVRNLDRLIGAGRRDARLCRPKIHVADRVITTAATAASHSFEFSDWSICEPEGLQLALDHDLIFSCVDRPWPRAVLNSLAYSDLIPVIDGGIAIDTFDDGSMRNAVWRSHIIRPQRPCMRCNRQLDLAEAARDRQGLLDDPAYIMGAGQPTEPVTQNVAPLSVNVAASLLAQYVSFSVAPAGVGDPGPLHYTLSSHHLERRDYRVCPDCPVELQEAEGDDRIDLTDHHEQAERQRQLADSPVTRTRLLRWVDDRTQAVTRWLDRR